MMTRKGQKIDPTSAKTSNFFARRSVAGALDPLRILQVRGEATGIALYSVAEALDPLRILQELRAYEQPAGMTVAEGDDPLRILQVRGEER